MPARAEEIRDGRTGHKGNVITKPLTDLLYRVAEKQRVVRRSKRVLRCEGEFHLSRTPFIFDRRQRETELQKVITEYAQEIGDLIAAAFREVLKPVLENGDLRRFWRPSRILGAQHRIL